MNLIAELLGLLAIICVALAGIAGVGILAALRLRHASQPESTTQDPNGDREKEP